MKKISSISIIDDDELFQFTIKKILSLTEITDKILQFPDGEQALDYFEKNKDNDTLLPDLIFLDINMPVINGWQFLENFTSTKVTKKRITIYICSSSENHFDREQFKRYSKLAGFLLKPLHKQDIYEVLDRELTNHYPIIFDY